jgi:hypothetical protein
VLDSSADDLLIGPKFEKSPTLITIIRVAIFDYIARTIKLVPCHTFDTETNHDIRSDLDSVHIPSNSDIEERTIRPHLAQSKATRETARNVSPSQDCLTRYHYAGDFRHISHRNVFCLVGWISKHQVCK